MSGLFELGLVVDNTDVGTECLSNGSTDKTALVNWRVVFRTEKAVAYVLKQNIAVTVAPRRFRLVLRARTGRLGLDCESQ